MEIVAATDLAMFIYETLKPYCEKIHIAGSVRRRNPDVGDIELVLIPLMTTIKVKNLFGETEAPTVRPEFLFALDSLGVKIKGNGLMKYCQIALNGVNMNLDVFMPDPTDFYRQYAIRTGPANYSQHTIAGGWRRMGWVGSDIGLRRYDDCREITDQKTGKKSYVCEKNKDRQPPAWASEKAFFEWLNVPFQEPKYRK